MVHTSTYWYILVHLEPRFHVYTWNIPCISHVYAVLIDIHGISMDIHGYTMYIQRGGYTWYIHGYPCISIMYIPRISMDIHGISIDVYPWYIQLMYIHGIYVVYPWIFLDF